MKADARPARLQGRAGRWPAILLVLILVVLGVPALPAHSNAETAVVRVLPVGDSVTGGGTGAVDTYRYPLYVHYTERAVAWQPVGPFSGVSYLSAEPAVGYAAWPEVWTRHAGRNGWSLDQLNDHVREWVAAHDPDVVVALPAFISQGTAATQHFERFINEARAGRPDVKVLFALPYHGTPFTAAETEQYRARLTAVARAMDTSASPVKLVDMGEGWREDFHGAGGTQGRYPAEPEGNRRVAMRWTDALWAYWQIGAPWPEPAAASLRAESHELNWDFDDRADAWEIERDGDIVGTVPSRPGEPQTFSGPAGTYRVRGLRSTGTPDAPGTVTGAWSAPLAFVPDPDPEPSSVVWTDFSEYGLGGAPGDWRVRWNVGQAALQVVGDAQEGRVLRITTSGTARKSYSWDAVEGLAGREDFQALAKVRVDQVAGNVPVGLGGRGGGVVGKEDWVGAVVSNGERLRGIHYTGGSSAWLSSTPVGLPAGAWAWLLVEVEGGRLRAKQWVDGAGEPAGWQTDVAFAGPAGPGWVGLHANTTATTIDVAYFSVGTGGADAPRPLH